jgi:uncharacterized membrane protein YccC
MYVPATDKLLHFAAGVLAALLGACIAGLALYLRVPVWPAWVCALLACAVAAVAREAYNWKQGGKFDWRDISATLAGGLPVAIAAALPH